MGALSGIGLNHQVVLAVLELKSKHAEITIFRHGRCRRRQELGHAFLKAIAVAANLRHSGREFRDGCFETQAFNILLRLVQRKNNRKTNSTLPGCTFEKTH